jgi:WD repeat-containing protein 81
LSSDPWGWDPWDRSSGAGSSSSGGIVGRGGSGTAGGTDGASRAAAAAVLPHHISNEPMSELSYAIYMARRLPVDLLVQLVRRSFR